MKVFHIGKYYPPFEGGIENFLAALLECSSTRGVRHFVLAHHHRLWRKSSLEELPETTLLRSATLARLLFAPLSPLFYFHMKSHVRAFAPDVIHVHMPNLSAFWLLLPGPWHRIPIVIHWHADVVPSRKNILLSLAYTGYRVLEKKLLARARAVIVTSVPYLQTSKPLQPWRDKCHVIPLGLPRENPAPLQASTASWRHKDSFKLLCVGRLTYYKGQEVLIRAIAELPDVELILVGTGKYRQKYQALVDRYHLGGRARLYGHASKAEMDALLDGCDCLCLPSIERTEAFGLVLLEAMQHGKPCICSDIAGSGMSWVVEHGTTGLHVKSGDVDSLRQAINTLAGNPALARAMGESGRERFSGVFDIEQVTNKILALYNALNTDQRPAKSLSNS